MADTRLPTQPPAPGRSRGQAMVEFSLVIMLFLGMAMGVFEGARLVLGYFALGQAAGEGARAGAFTPTSRYPTTTLDAGVRAAVRSTTSFLGTIPDDHITICRRTTSTAACGTPVHGGSVIEVTVRHTFAFLPFAGGWLGQVSIPLTGYHRARIE